MQVSDYRPKELRHHVIVRTRPSVRVLTPSLTVGQGENASLQCEVAGGSPEPELSWARPGHSISTSQVLEINTKIQKYNEQQSLNFIPAVC